MRCLPPRYRKRYGPNREEPLLAPAKEQNCDARTFRITSDARRSTSPGIPSQQARNAAKDRAAANPWISFVRLASEIASAIFAWQEAIAPRCHSDKATLYRQATAG